MNANTYSTPTDNEIWAMDEAWRLVMNSEDAHPTAITFTCKGSVRGSCGHTHTSRRDAAICVVRDGRDCRRAGGYSDRTILPA